MSRADSDGLTPCRKLNWCLVRNTDESLCLSVTSSLKVSYSEELSLL